MQSHVPKNDDVMLVVSIDMTSNAAVAAAAEVAVDWKATVPIGRWTVRNVEQVPLDINDEGDGPDEDGSSRLSRVTTLTLPA